MALFGVTQVCNAQGDPKAFPEWQVAPIWLQGSWERAESVVVGDVTNVIALGAQRIEKPPQWVPSDLHEIYWCQGDFRADFLIRGHLPASGRKFLWAAARPGCGWVGYGYQESTPPVTRIWLIREEGDYIRPTVDSGGVYFIAFHSHWNDVAKEQAPRILALLLLTPSALGLSLRESSITLNDRAGLAREILGDDELTARLMALAAFPDADLHKAVCAYLERNFDRSCR